MSADHPHARPGRTDDVVELFEGFDDLPGDVPGVRRVAAVVGRLSAAGLRLRHAHRAARLFQQLDRGEPHVGAEKIDKAGHEETDARFFVHLRRLKSFPVTYLAAGAEISSDLNENPLADRSDQAVTRVTDSFLPRRGRNALFLRTS